MPGGKLKKASESKEAAWMRAAMGVGPDDEVIVKIPLGEENVKMNDVKLEACARVAHEANRAYCIAIGDLSQVSWEEALENQRSSAVNGVRGVLAGDTPRQSHETWLEEKRATGWKYGPVKDPEKKEHPCFVPYAELPFEQRAKDFLFVGVVKAMAVALGLM